MSFIPITNTPANNITALNNKCSSKKIYSDVEDTHIMAAGFEGKTNKFWQYGIL